MILGLHLVYVLKSFQIRNHIHSLYIIHYHPEYTTHIIRISVYKNNICNRGTKYGLTVGAYVMKTCVMALHVRHSERWSVISGCLVLVSFVLLSRCR